MSTKTSIHNNCLALLWIVVLIFSLFGVTPLKVGASTDVPVYTDALAPGWTDWSWDTERSFNHHTTVRGTASISVTVTTGWGGLSLRTSSVITTSDFNAVTFWVRGDSSGPSLQFYVQATDYGAASNTLEFTAPANAWKQITATMAALGNPATLARLNFQDTSGADGYTVYIDDIRIVANPILTTTADVHIQAGGTITPIAARLLGSNIAAWNGQSTYENERFRARTASSGLSVLRMPGGSYSNNYGWLSCEMRHNQPGALPCGDQWESWVARPTDFINFLRAVNIEGMWVASITGTVQEAEAAVAFFNSAITDTTTIGTDIHATNWYTAGHWARLRADHGNPLPIGIKLWGIGNEVYGSKPATGGAVCQSWGWEDMWTCDGTEYVTGKGSGANRHAGFNEFRTAMQSIDPSIQVGAIGVPVQSSWTGWGNKVIAAAGQKMDFYDIHQYAYDNPPATAAMALEDPETTWAEIKADIAAASAANAGGRNIPIGVSEFNIFSSWNYDTGAWMTQATAGLFVADSIGQMMNNSYALANQWLLSGNTQSNGTDYGLINAENVTMTRSPQYFAYPLWARFGNSMLPLTSTLNAATQLSLYAGRAKDLVYSVMAINKTGVLITASIDFTGAPSFASAVADVVQATALSDTTVMFNGVSENALADDLSNAPSQVVTITPGTTHVTTAFAPYSMTLLRITPQIAARTFLPLVRKT